VYIEMMKAVVSSGNFNNASGTAANIAESHAKAILKIM
jgi:hypothetical protein